MTGKVLCAALVPRIDKLPAERLFGLLVDLTQGLIDAIPLLADDEVRVVHCVDRDTGVLTERLAVGFCTPNDILSQSLPLSKTMFPRTCIPVILGEAQAL